MNQNGENAPAMILKLKVWLEDTDGDSILGDGRIALLREIECTGSISAAARNLNLSYRKAWNDLQKIEQRLGFPTIIKERGGTAGGRTELTSNCLIFLQLFDQFRSRLNAHACEDFRIFLNDFFSQTDKENT